MARSSTADLRPQGAQELAIRGTDFAVHRRRHRPRCHTWPLWRPHPLRTDGACRYVIAAQDAIAAFREPMSFEQTAALPLAAPPPLTCLAAGQPQAR
jgi:hypothetical protein